MVIPDDISRQGQIDFYQFTFRSTLPDGQGALVSRVNT
jgi:hypothetical protein